MKRLAIQNKNTSEEYDGIFEERRKRGINLQDMRRWKILVKNFKGGKVIDIGCLDSMIFSFLVWKFKDVKYLGIDIAKESIAKMSLRYGDSPKAKFEVRDCYDTKLPNGFFDYAVMGELLEHLEEPEKAIGEAMRILKSKGTLAVSIPLNEEKEPGAVDKAHHLWSFTIKDMTDLLKPRGRVKIETIGSRYFPFYQYHFPTLIAFCKKK